MRFTSFAAALLAAGAVVAAPGAASAAPSGSPLPDADLFCGPAHWQQVTFAFGHPTADAFWITSQPYRGKWNIADEAHYLGSGLGYQPVDLDELTPTSSTYQFLDEKSFGTKTGQGESVTCEVVSRWKAGTAGPQDITVYAPVMLVRVG